jgi:hypothetical protein
VTPTQELIVPIVAQNPGIAASAIAKRLGMDRNNIRKAALDLADAGELRAEANGNGYVFYPVNGCAASMSTPPRPNGPAEPIDADFRIIPQDTFDSRLAGSGPPAAQGSQRASTSRTLSVPGTPQYMPGDPRGRQLEQLQQYGSAWDIRPRTFDGRNANGFAVFADDQPLAASPMSSWKSRPFVKACISCKTTMPG